MQADQQCACVAQTAPTADALTPYDEAHFALYLSLLHASADGVSDVEMCREILGIEPENDPLRAQTMLQTHLDRARWLSSTGRRHILEG
jgi:hypothetical protein